MKFTNRQFGEFEYDASHVIDFPQGIIGFEHLRKFIIINDEDAQPFRWLVSLEDRDLNFPLLDPSVVTSDYASYLPDLRIHATFLVASLHDTPEETSVNLRSPIVIEEATGQGRQIILANEALPLRHQFLSSHPSGNQ